MCHKSLVLNGNWIFFSINDNSSHISKYEQSAFLPLSLIISKILKNIFRTHANVYRSHHCQTDVNVLQFLDVISNPIPNLLYSFYVKARTPYSLYPQHEVPLAHPHRSQTDYPNSCKICTLLTLIKPNTNDMHGSEKNWQYTNLI